MVAICVLIVLAAAMPMAVAQPRSSEGAGALLYESHCQGCHTSQVHWRDRKQATDLDSLQKQVARWQANIGLRWSAKDIDEVSRYLNRRYYKFDEPGRAWQTGAPEPG